MIRYRNAQLQFKCESGHGGGVGCRFSVDSVLFPDSIVHFYGYYMDEHLKEMTRR